MRRITHVFAALAAAVMAFIVTPAGQALVHQYPILSGIIGVLGAAGAVYHQPERQ